LAETPDLQDERVPTSNYASRQQPLFNNSKLPPAIETNLAINNIGVFQVSNISSTVQNLLYISRDQVDIAFSADF